MVVGAWHMANKCCSCGAGSPPSGRRWCCLPHSVRHPWPARSTPWSTKHQAKRRREAVRHSLGCQAPLAKQTAEPARLLAPRRPAPSQPYLPRLLPCRGRSPAAGAAHPARYAAPNDGSPPNSPGCPARRTLVCRRSSPEPARAVGGHWQLPELPTGPSGSLRHQCRRSSCAGAAAR